MKKILFALLFAVAFGVETQGDYWYVSSILLVLAGFFNLFSNHKATRFIMGFLPLILAALSLPSAEFSKILPGLNFFTFGTDGAAVGRLILIGLLFFASFVFIRKHDTGFKWSRVILIGVVALFGYMETASKEASGYAFVGGDLLNLSLLIVAGIYLFKKKENGGGIVLKTFGGFALIMGIIGVLGFFEIGIPFIGVGTPGRFVMLLILLLYMLFRRDSQTMYSQYYGRGNP